MTTAVVWSSPNRNGLTASAKERIISGIQNYGSEVDEIHLNALRVKLCQACGNGWGTCRANGSCILSDDFADIYERLVRADGIVFVTAVYWHDMTEFMKALLDRLRRCETAHNGFLRGKRCLITACAGGTGLGAVECLQNMEQTLGHMGMRVYDRLSVIRYNKEYMLDTLEKAGEVYARRTAEGFDMQY